MIPPVSEFAIHFVSTLLGYQKSFIPPRNNSFLLTPVIHNSHRILFSCDIKKHCIDETDRKTENG